LLKMITTLLKDTWLYLAPYQTSWLAIMVFGLAAFCFWRGRRIQAQGKCLVSRWRASAFWVGLALCYVALHTRFDYYSQFMFFVHRGQHLIIHHLGPLLIALAAPWSTLAAGFPDGAVKQRLAQLLRSPVVMVPYRVLQHPLVAPVLFVGLIFFWLWPSLHFNAMLNHKLYLIMNWSMFIDGLLFWWLILDPRDPIRSGTIGLGKRIFILVAITLPQLLLGATMTFSKDILYEIYAICGRAWPIAPHTDQVLGGILTWIPPSMMAVVAMLIVLSRLLRQSEKPHTTSYTNSYSST
jgi:putative membrane protein